jgi:hypothetical protein
LFACKNRPSQHGKEDEVTLQLWVVTRRKEEKEQVLEELLPSQDAPTGAQ